MIREIKFRAWDKEECEMLSDVSILDDTWDMLNEFLKHKDELAFMQYTGIKDKKGVEIYEGDIYHHGDPRITYTVVWVDGGLMGKQNSSTSYAGLESWCDQIEVIGNIYENPELLEDDAE